MVASFNLTNLSLSSSNSTRPSTPLPPSIVSPTYPATTKPTSPLISNTPITMDGEMREGRVLERVISDGKKKHLGGLTITLNNLLSNPSRSNSNSTTPTSATTTISRPISDGNSGLLSLKNLHLSSNSSSNGKQRSQSAAPIPGNTRGKSSINSTPLLATNSSQGSTSRLASSTTSVLKSFLPSSSSSQPSSKPSSRMVSPIATPHGISTPLPNQSMSNSRSSTPALHTLEESYVGKVTARLGEAVNRVFVGPPNSTTTADMNKMHAPKWLKAREVGELIFSELETAQHDPYLLRTLLRSSVLKSLSLFLSRLTTLLLPPSSYPTLDLKEIDNFPLPLRFNFEIVRSAFELKEGLRNSCNNLPSFVSEILRPWIAKFEELMNKVMGPIIIGLRITISAICAKAREEEVLEGNSISKVSVGRSLSMSRTTVPVITTTTGEPIWIKELVVALEATSKLLNRLECGRDTEKWLVNLGTCAVWKGMLALSCRKIMIDSSDCINGNSSPQPSLSSTKSLLKPTPRSSPTSITSPSLALLPSGLSPRLEATKSLPTIGSPHLSPNFISIHSSPTTSATPSTSNDTHLSDLAFIKLLGELELFELRLIHFVSNLNHPCPTPDILMSGKCSESLNCGLCRTGRTFDAESSDEEEEEEGIELAQCAMREAMQALSAMIIVLRASFKTSVLKEALLFAAGGGIGAVVSNSNSTKSNSPQVTTDAKKLVREEEELKPLTPLALLSIPLVLDEKDLLLSTFPITPTPACPTLAHALDTVPTLILIHILISRLPNSLHFKLPHEIWELEYRDYTKELRGFSSANEWTEEISWELAGEISNVKDEILIEEGRLLDQEEKDRLNLLSLVLRTKVNVEVIEV